MKLDRKIFKYIDWHLFLIYIIIVIIGILSIYSVGYSKSIYKNFLGISSRTFKQSIWLFISLISFLFIINIDNRYFQSLSYLIYLFSLFLLVGTFIIGKTFGGHNSWYHFKVLSFQPSEFIKLSTSFAIAKFLKDNKKGFNSFRNVFIASIIIGLPMIFILMQGDLGTSIIFSSLIIVAYREGLSVNIIVNILKLFSTVILSLFIPKIYLIVFLIIYLLLKFGLLRSKKEFFSVFLKFITALILVTSTDIVIFKFLKPHQINRIKALINPKIDPKGISWNVVQSKIAIGSGGLFGKGFLKGTQTKFGFVPQQETDFIFCTIGEEFGFLGSLILILLFIFLLNRILIICERQKSKYQRVYGYSIFSIIAFHFIINIGMTIGIMPVIGIPLPFITYGGSSLFTFSLMIFVLLKIDADRTNYISNKKKVNIF